jgi:Uma2 family endonuclease
MSLADFMALPDDGNHTMSSHEFVRGEVRVMPPPKGRHGRVETALLAAIDRYLDQRARALGRDPEHGLDARDRLVGFVAGGAFGMQFTVPDDPNQVRGADGVYVPAEQYARVTWDEQTYFPEVAHLVIEVISPSETATDVGEKVQDYLAGGARRVWCVYPLLRTVHIHDVDGPTRVVRWNSTLTDEELLPGLALPLRGIFPAPPER